MKFPEKTPRSRRVLRPIPGLRSVTFALAAVTGSILSAGCSESGSIAELAASPGSDAKGGGPSTYGLTPQLVTEEYVAMLTEKANALAKKELARMSAIELTYRNKTELHADPLGRLGNLSNMYLKMYRNFTDYTIRDIYRSESFLYPVAFEIEYRYELLATPAKNATMPDAEKLAIAERQFNVLRRESLIRRYRCDATGDYVGAMEDLPPRPDFWNLDPSTKPEPGAAMPNRFPPGGPQLRPGQTVPPIFSDFPPAPAPQ